LLLALAVAPASRATGELPAELRASAIQARPGSSLPADAAFVDEGGRPVTLAGYLAPGRPVFLVFAYHRCPMLCGLVLDGLGRSLRALPSRAGKDYTLLVVSFDPADTPELAASKRAELLAALAADERAAAGIHFLTGGEAAIAGLADSVGFRYRRQGPGEPYAHEAALFVVTPEGRLSRVLFGVDHAPRDLKLALAEARAGSIVATPLEHVLLFCFPYDARTGRYTLSVLGLVRVAGVATALAVLAFVLHALARERRARRTEKPTPGPEGPSVETA
jgi:protein SCO1/2